MALRRGSGEPLLLIHGLGGSALVWEPAVDLLAAEREVVVLDMAGFGDAPPLPDGVEPTAANLAAALHEQCLELGIERPHVAGNSLGGWAALEMGRAGWAASVTAISPAGLWRRPLGPRRRDPRRWAQRLRPLADLALRAPGLRRRALATFAAKPERIPAATGRELVLGWIDADGYDGANRAMRSHVFDPAGYPDDMPVTIAWCELDRLVAPPRPERCPAGARLIVLPGVGHTPTWDDPELVAAALLQGSALPAAARRV
ncbi:MAG TPA: alpha/beta fold hydrolase [Solirubrobacterales bacterium]|jgi:pimeloyl-ACP methyl ester carboxylesterase|nr:alpha/beta fold hydrolase [Solirubrobacterales bacterium]